VRLRTIAGVLVAGAVLAALGIAAFAVAGEGKSHFKSDELTGYQEGPAISSTGTGSFVADLNESAMTLTYTLSYSDVEGGTPAQAHIHIGKRAENGGVIAFLCGGGDKPPCPPEGSVSGVIDPADVIGPASQGIEPGSFVELVAALRAGVAYANVHNARWPNGEIRGQINDNNQREP
jgi:hypothetical protein